MTADLESRLAQLGLELPPCPEPRGAYESVAIHGSTAYVSGQVSRIGNEVIAGPVTRATPPDVLRFAAQTCVLRALSALAAHLPAAAAIDRILFLRGFVNAVPEFTSHGLVMDAASKLLQALFGECGRHARSALGVASLPDGGLLEIELTVALKPAIAKS